MVLRGTKPPSRQTGFTTILLTPTIATSGRLTIGVETMPPSAPSEVSVIVDPDSSSRAAIPLRAASLTPAHLARALVEAERLGVAHHRDHQPGRRLGRDAEMHARHSVG